MAPTAFAGDASDVAGRRAARGDVPAAVPPDPHVGSPRLAARARATTVERLRRDPWVTTVVSGLAVTWLVELVVLSQRAVVQVHQGRLSLDFAHFYQAWTLMSRGDVDPHSTVLNGRYLEFHGEFVMAPLSLLRLLDSGPETLLVVQAAAQCAAAFAASLWVLDAGRRGLRRTETAGRATGPIEKAVRLIVLPVGVTVLFLLNPYLTDAATMDFHFQAVATLFLVLTGRDIAAGRRRAWCWAALALASGDVSTTFVIGLALSVLLHGRRFLTPGLVLLAVAVAWLAVVGAVGFDHGSNVKVYGYLIGRGTPPADVTTAAVLIAILTRPGRALDSLHARWPTIVTNLAPTGWVGALHPWTIGVCLVAVLESDLNPLPIFTAPGFQQLPLYVFATLGTGLLGQDLAALVCRLDRAGLRRAGCAAVAVGFAVLTTVVAVVPARADPYFGEFRLTAATSGTIAEVRSELRPGDEVVSSLAVVGNFANRTTVYPIVPVSTSFPIAADRVVLVICFAGNQPIAVPILQNLIAQARARPGSEVLVDTGVVVAVAFPADPGDPALHVAA